MCARLLHAIDALCRKVDSEKREFNADDWKTLAKDTTCKLYVYIVKSACKASGLAGQTLGLQCDFVCSSQN